MYMDISNNEGVSAPLIPKLYLKINLVLMKKKMFFLVQWLNKDFWIGIKMAFFHNLVTILSSGIKMYQISFQGQKINKEMSRDEKCTFANNISTYA